MFSLNRAQIVGNVTRDPELRYIPSGQAVCSFGIATNRRWRDKDGNNQEQTEFHNIVAWAKAAEIISQYVKKGTKLYIEGRLQTRSWEGQDGAKRNRTEIVVENFIILTPKGAATTNLPASPSKDLEEFPTSTETPASDSATAGKPKELKPDKGEAETPAKDKKSKEEKEEPADDDINLDEIPF